MRRLGCSDCSFGAFHACCHGNHLRIDVETVKLFSESGEDENVSLITKIGCLQWKMMLGVTCCGEYYFSYYVASWLVAILCSCILCGFCSVRD